MSKMHALKSRPEFFAAMLAGDKTHDLRRNDRNFAKGDSILFQEFDPEAGYSGREIEGLVTFITSDDIPCAESKSSIHPDFCILSIRIKFQSNK